MEKGTIMPQTRWYFNYSKIHAMERLPGVTGGAIWWRAICRRDIRTPQRHLKKPPYTPDEHDTCKACAKRLRAQAEDAAPVELPTPSAN